MDILAAEVMFMDSNTPLDPQQPPTGRPGRRARKWRPIKQWFTGASRSTLMGILAGVVVVGGAAYAAANLGGFRTVHTTVPGTAVRRHAANPSTPPSTAPTAPTARPGSRPTAAMLRMPVAGPVAAPFGWVYSTRLGEWYYNPGVTLAAKPGTLVHAGWGGRVAAVGQEPLMGLTVEVNDGSGFTTFYGNLGQARVKVGQMVSQGAVIGTVAAPSLYTRVAGSHVDFQVFQNSQAVNPAHFLHASS